MTERGTKREKDRGRCTVRGSETVTKRGRGRKKRRREKRKMTGKVYLSILPCFLDIHSSFWFSGSL